MLTAVTSRLSEHQTHDRNGRNVVRTLIGCILFRESTTETLESCDTQANREPSGEKATQ